MDERLGIMIINLLSRWVAAISPIILKTVNLIVKALIILLMPATSLNNKTRSTIFKPSKNFEEQTHKSISWRKGSRSFKGKLTSKITHSSNTPTLSKWGRPSSKTQISSSKNSNIFSLLTLSTSKKSKRKATNSSSSTNSLSRKINLICSTTKWNQIFNFGQKVNKMKDWSESWKKKRSWKKDKNGKRSRRSPIEWGTW